MRASELARVCGLRISNSFGSITFVDAVDCRGLDFAKVFAIHGRADSHRQGVTVNHADSSQFSSTRAIVTLCDVYPVDKKSGAAAKPSDSELYSKFRHKLIKACEAQGTTFESYDADERRWSFRVEHFSGYYVPD